MGNNDSPRFERTGESLAGGITLAAVGGTGATLAPVTPDIGTYLLASAPVLAASVGLAVRADARAVGR